MSLFDRAGKDLIHFLMFYMSPSTCLNMRSTCSRLLEVVNCNNVYWNGYVNCETRMVHTLQPNRSCLNVMGIEKCCAILGKIEGIKKSVPFVLSQLDMFGECEKYLLEIYGHPDFDCTRKSHMQAAGFDPVFTGSQTDDVEPIYEYLFSRYKKARARAHFFASKTSASNRGRIKLLQNKVFALENELRVARLDLDVANLQTREKVEEVEEGRDYMSKHPFFGQSVCGYIKKRVQKKPRK